MPTHLQQTLSLAHARYQAATGEADRARVEMFGAIRSAREAGATNQEIGNVLGVTRQRVSQMLRKEEEK